MAEPPWLWHYELVPLFPQPHLDLSVSLRSHYVTNPALRRLLRVVGASVFTFLGYIVFLVITMTVFIVPVSIGRPLAVTGALCGLPAALISISNLRYEMVVVLIKTHDCWFFTVVCSLFVVVLSLVFGDARSAILVVSFLSFVTNVFIDASVVGQRRFWIANLVSVFCHAIMGTTVSLGITDKIQPFNLFELNGYALPAVAVVRDSLGSMTTVLLRNLFREFYHRTKRSKVTVDGGIRVVTCVSYRCRLRVQAVAVGGPVFDIPTSTRIKSSRGTSVVSFSDDGVSTPTPLQYIPFVDSVDARATVVPSQWLWDRVPSRSHLHKVRNPQRCLHCVGAFGFLSSALALLVTLVSPAFARRRWYCSLVAVGAGSSALFIGTSLAIAQRKVLHAIATSFDFLFIAIQVTIVYACLADLGSWHPVMLLAIFSLWLWTMWILCWDALLPPSRLLLGLQDRAAVLVGSALGVLLVCSIVLMFVILPRHSIHDRAVLRIGFDNHNMEIRPLSWYVSCCATVSAWAVRVIWRLWHTSGGDLVVLDGRVAYEYRSAKHRSRRILVAPATQDINPTRTAVAPHALH